MRATYCGLMSEIDDQLGRVFDYLKQTGQWDDTLIVFTCDHGEQLGRPSPAGQDRLFRRVLPHPDDHPRSARRRRTARAARIVERFTETIDTMPTILEWLGLDVPRQCDGRSLLPFCEGERAGRLAHRGALRVRLPRPALQQAGIGARRADGQVRARRRAGRGLQVRAFRGPAAAVLRPQEGPRPVREPRRRSGLCRAAWANTPPRC